MTPDDLRQDVELKIVDLIKQKLSDGTMTEERSQQIAQHVLEKLKPGMTFSELHKAIFKLDDMYGELSPVILPFIRDYERLITAQARHQVAKMIQTGQYDAAEKLGKDVISGDVNIVWQASAKPPKA